MVRAKKSLGQNFLIHTQIASRIVHAAEVSADDTVLEIGAGTGKLTRELLKSAGHVIALEADAELLPLLTETFASEIASGALTLIHTDVRAFSPDSLPPYKLVANIPYYITGEIIRTFLTATHKPLSMTLLVQKEVAVRIARSKKESLLSLGVKAYGTPQYCFTVPRGAFMPSPNVDSAVIHIRDIRTPFIDTGSEERFFSILHAGFAHKRKFLAKNLESVAHEEAIRKAFNALHIDAKVRAEDLSLPVWTSLAARLPSRRD